MFGFCILFGLFLWFGVLFWGFVASICVSLLWFTCVFVSALVHFGLFGVFCGSLFLFAALWWVLFSVLLYFCCSGWGLCLLLFCFCLFTCAVSVVLLGLSCCAFCVWGLGLYLRSCGVFAVSISVWSLGGFCFCSVYGVVVFWCFVLSRLCFFVCWVGFGVLSCSVSVFHCLWFFL